MPETIFSSGNKMSSKAFDDDLGDNFLTSWKPGKINSDAGLDLGDCPPRISSKKFSLAKLDMDFDFDGGFSKLASFDIDLSGLDSPKQGNSPKKGVAKSPKKGAKSPGKSENRKPNPENMDIDFDFNGFSRFGTFELDEPEIFNKDRVEIPKKPIDKKEFSCSGLSGKSFLSNKNKFSMKTSHILDKSDASGPKSKTREECSISGFSEKMHTLSARVLSQKSENANTDLKLRSIDEAESSFRAEPAENEDHHVEDSKAKENSCLDTVGPEREDLKSTPTLVEETTNDQLQTEKYAGSETRVEQGDELHEDVAEPPVEQGKQRLDEDIALNQNLDNGEKIIVEFRDEERDELKTAPPDNGGQELDKKLSGFQRSALSDTKIVPDCGENIVQELQNGLGTRDEGGDNAFNSHPELPLSPLLAASQPSDLRSSKSSQSLPKRPSKPSLSTKSSHRNKQHSGENILSPKLAQTKAVTPYSKAQINILRSPLQVIKTNINQQVNVKSVNATRLSMKKDALQPTLKQTSQGLIGASMAANIKHASAGKKVQVVSSLRSANPTTRTPSHKRKPSELLHMNNNLIPSKKIRGAMGMNVLAKITTENALRVESRQAFEFESAGQSPGERIQLGQGSALMRDSKNPQPTATISEFAKPFSPSLLMERRPSNLDDIIENNEIIEKADKYSKDLEEMCKMLKKKQEEAKDLFVTALVSNNTLLMLNNPMEEDKIQSLKLSIQNIIDKYCITMEE